MDDREKEATELLKNINLRKYIMLDKSLVEEIFLLPLDVPYGGGH